MVVDDDENAGKLAVAHLQREGYETLYAPDGETGLKIASIREPDVILLDLTMPGIDGFEVCSRLKAEDKTKKIPIIILSSQRERNQVLKALQKGADDFIVKPLDAQVMLHKLKTVLPPHPAEAGSEEEAHFEEKREFVRLSQPTEATIELPLEILDISEGGLAVLSETPIPVGKIFTINSPLLKEILQMEDIPVRITHSICDRIDRPCRLGAEFVGLPESARKKMRQYIFKKETERVRVK
ncbi:MAG: response regulator [Candidatus Omnitrophica bacterium]|nr:response regulator [Candidatus Omnitrophota bacterium]MCA9434914.1 response regulator [Candidatus Omnitrophota bacterium]